MPQEDIIQKWLDHVHEDLSAAEDMWKTGHWLYVAFLCHQAIEKVLKAYYVAINNEDPPYTHSHGKLIDACGLLMSFRPNALGSLISWCRCTSRPVILNRK